MCRRNNPQHQVVGGTVLCSPERLHGRGHAPLTSAAVYERSLPLRARRGLWRRRGILPAVSVTRFCQQSLCQEPASGTAFPLVWADCCATQGNPLEPASLNQHCPPGPPHASVLWLIWHLPNQRTTASGFHGLSIPIREETSGIRIFSPLQWLNPDYHNGWWESCDCTVFVMGSALGD